MKTRRCSRWRRMLSSSVRPWRLLRRMVYLLPSGCSWDREHVVRGWLNRMDFSDVYALWDVAQPTFEMHDPLCSFGLMVPRCCPGIEVPSLKMNACDVKFGRTQQMFCVKSLSLRLLLRPYGKGCAVVYCFEIPEWDMLTNQSGIESTSLSILSTTT